MSRAVDDAMTAHAARRGTVYYGGVPATLIAWRPRRNNRRGRTNTARIDMGRGPFTVKADAITVLAVAT